MKFNKNNLKSIFVLSIFTFILLWSAYFFCANLGINPVYDFLIKGTSPVKSSQDIVIVTIDDQSIKRIGRWPWKRTYYTDIFEYLENVAGVKVIAFDSVIVSYGDENDDKEFFSRFSKLNKVIPGVFFSKQKSYFHNENEKNLANLFSSKFSINTEDLRHQELKEKSKYTSSSYSLEEVMSGAKNMGSVLSHPDNDGIIRKSEPVFSYKNNYYPSLALAVFKQFNPDANFKIKKNSLQISSKEKNFEIPLFSSQQGSFSYIRWYKSLNKDYSYPYKTISAWKIIESYQNIQQGKPSLINASVFKDKIVVVGATSTTLKDIKSTPLKVDYPGVYIQATLIDNILNNDFIIKPSEIQKFSLLTAILILGFLAIFCLSPVYSSVLLILSAVGYFYVCLFFAYPNNIALDPITPIAFIIVVMLVGYGYEYFIEDNKKRKTRDLIAKYVSKDIMEAILKDVDKTKLGGKRSDISVLFVDIRNFTQLSEIMDPEKVSELLNEYFSEMIPIIFKYKGTVNKFIGDAILAIFGAPLEYPQHPEMAVKCALEMQNKTTEIKSKWIEENKPEIDIGIGISTGEAFVGNVGSDERFEYSVIGNTVNVANRLEAFNKIYKTSILISEDTFERVKDIIEAQQVDSVCVTQNSEPIKIYELLSLKSEK